MRFTIDGIDLARKLMGSLRRHPRLDVVSMKEMDDGKCVFTVSFDEEDADAQKSMLFHSVRNCGVQFQEEEDMVSMVERTLDMLPCAEEEADERVRKSVEEWRHGDGEPRIEVGGTGTTYVTTCYSIRDDRRTVWVVTERHDCCNGIIVGVYDSKGKAVDAACAEACDGDASCDVDNARECLDVEGRFSHGGTTYLLEEKELL